LRLLFIVHATAWSDKACVAQRPIQDLIDRGGFDQIVEVAQMRPDIKAGRYLNHQGTVFQHEEISPVRFFREDLFGEAPLFPSAEQITLVGGVLNYDGGCLNVAFDSLVRHMKHLSRPCTITIPFCATYREHDRPSWEKPWEVRVAMKDFAWKMLAAEVAFELSDDTGRRIASGREPLIKVGVQAPPCGF